MDPTQKLSITLPGPLAKLVRDKVESGAYASNSEVIRTALRSWQESEAEREQHLESIRARIDESIKDPRPLLTAEEVREHLDRLHQETVKARRDR